MPAPKPIERPDIIIPDTGPLIHLAQADALPLLHQVGGKVVLADMVAFEATQDLTKPGAAQVRDWIAAGQMPGSNALVTVEATDTGRLFAAARLSDPDIKARGAGERAIVDWLAEKVQGTDHAVMVVYENGKVPRIIANQGIDANIDVVTTSAFLQLAMKQGDQAGASDYWAKVVSAVPTANPAETTTMQRRSRLSS